MFSNSSKSKRFAEIVVQRFGGKLKECNVTFSSFKTARVMADVIFDGMEMEAYFFSPFIYIRIKKFHLNEDVNFAVKTKMESLGLNELIDDAFQNYDAPVYSNKGYSLEGLREFCLDEANEDDIRRMALRPGEILGIANSQITLLIEGDDIDQLYDRLTIASSIFHRNRVKRLKLFNKSAYGITIGDPIDGCPDTGHVFGGGLDAKGLVCKNCNRDIDLLLRVDLEDPDLKTKTTKDRFIYVMACLTCEHGLSPLFINYTNEEPSILEQPEGETFGDFTEQLSPRSVQMTPLKRKQKKDNQPLHKFGGKPDWVQNEDIPLCHKCSAEMAFFLQLDSDPELDIQFGDDGRLFAFICPKCKVIATFMQGR